MNSGHKKVFLGIGLGAVQSGLFLYEAYKSGNFSRFIICEVNKKLVDEIKNESGCLWINTAHNDRIERNCIKGIEIFDPGNPADALNISAAIKEADEISTALPSTDFYDMGENSVAKLLAANINNSKQQVIYTAENNNFAAEILHSAILKYTTPDKLSNLNILNTVIGKMGGVINDEATIKEFGLKYITPGSKTAVLVEKFNDIIISRINLPGFKRGIEIFREKDDLLPFEEAKLFGHNAVHSMLGFFAWLRGYSYMSEIRNDDVLMGYGRKAFREESGAFLLKKYKNNEDKLFTKTGFDFYGSDLLDRITNPFLRDEVKRICRDPLRKLQYNDRFAGTIREALKQDVIPGIISKAVLAGICYVIENKNDDGNIFPAGISGLDEITVRNLLKSIWKGPDDDGLLDECIESVCSQTGEFIDEFISGKQGKFLK
jgi:mannitol-1-phosphate 5-dehydrogenase